MEFNKFTENILEKSVQLINDSFIKSDGLNDNIVRSINLNDSKSIQTVLNQLYFKLFDLDERIINNLLNEYYNL
jgi:hypothetical protein